MKVFIAGARDIRTLNEDVKIRIDNIMQKNLTILIGDANGVDRLVQKHLFDKGYEDVIIYASNGKARNNVGGWAVENVIVERKVKDFNYFVQKDKKMAKDAEYGFMIWNGISKGTLNNIINLISMEKPVLTFVTLFNRFVHLKNEDDVNNLINACGERASKVFEELKCVADKDNIESMVQITII